MSLNKMSANDSTQPLLADDEMEIWNLGDIDCRKVTTWNSDTEGSSSGYDSSLDGSDANDESSDSEFDSDNFSDDESNDDIDDVKDYKTTVYGRKESEVMTYFNAHALCDQLKYILSVPNLCDVKFEVGPEKIPVYGIKAITGTRSRTLYSLILKAQRESEEKSSKKSMLNKSIKKRQNKTTQHIKIEVSKYEPDDFRQIIRFIHCGSVEVSTDNVTGVLCGAVQFELEDLEKACWDFIERNKNLNTACKVTKSIQKYSQHKTAQKILLKVSEKMKTKREIHNKRETAV